MDIAPPRVQFPHPTWRTSPLLVALHRRRMKIHPQKQAVGAVPVTGHLDHLCITTFPTAFVLTSCTEVLLGLSVLQDSLLLSTLTPVLPQPGWGLMAALTAAPENPIMQNEAGDNWAIPPWEASILWTGNGDGGMVKSYLQSRSLPGQLEQQSLPRVAAN